MRMSTRFIEYLFEVWYVFKSDVALGNECISVNELEGIESKVTDAELQEVGKRILLLYKCYDVLDVEFENRLTESCIENVYKTYKQYKQQRSKDTLINMTHFDLDTSDTSYVASLDDVTTAQLMNGFGRYAMTGGDGDKYRYEYKFLFKDYKFSVYDYLNDENEWYKEEDIYWHVATNCTLEIVNVAFTKKITEIVNKIC